MKTEKEIEKKLKHYERLNFWWGFVSGFLITIGVALIIYGWIL